MSPREAFSFGTVAGAATVAVGFIVLASATRSCDRPPPLEPAPTIQPEPAPEPLSAQPSCTCSCRCVASDDAATEGATDEDAF